MAASGYTQCCRRETTHDVNTRQMMRSFVLTALTPLLPAASHWLQQIATLSHRVDGRLLSIFDLRLLQPLAMDVHVLVAMSTACSRRVPAEGHGYAHHAASA